MASQSDVMELAKSNGDICPICLDIIQIKITPARGPNCLCKQQACLHCFRDSLEMNSSKPKRGNCLIGCGIPFKLAKPPYEIADWVELGRLDSLYGAMDCPRECGWKGTRCDFQKYHREKCPNIIKNCHECHNKVKQDHFVMCRACHYEIPVCFIKSHINSACVSPRCDICNYALICHPIGICICGTSYKDCTHFSKCPMVYSDGSSLPDIKECHRCGVKHYSSDIEKCVMFISMFKKMNIETPFSKMENAKNDKN